MSGPIVRKYGFPNHERIFGKKEVEHGVEKPNDASAQKPEDTGTASSDTERTGARGAGGGEGSSD